MINMEIDQMMLEAIAEILEYFWYVIFYIMGILITAFMEIVIDYMTGELISNVEFMTFGFVILSTALILYLKFVR